MNNALIQNNAAGFGNIAQAIGFMDLPLVVRQQIYVNLFNGVFLYVGRNGNHRWSRDAHLAILATCGTISAEAKYLLFSHAMQVFVDDTNQNGEVVHSHALLQPLHCQLVPRIMVHNHSPNKNVLLTLTSPGLYSYESLRRLDLGVFSYIPLLASPHSLLHRYIQIDEETGVPFINEWNEEYVIDGSKQFLMDTSKFNKLAYRPINARGLRNIIEAKYRTFKVYLNCIVLLASRRPRDLIPVGYNGVVSSARKNDFQSSC